MKCLNLVLLLSFFPVLCFSQIKQGDINFGFSMGFYNNQVTEYDESEYTTDYSSISADIGYSITKNLNCGLYLGMQNGLVNIYNIDSYSRRSENQDRISLRPFIKYYFNPENDKRIFLQVNGVYNFRSKNTNKHIIIVFPVFKGNDDEIGFTVSPGIEISLGQRWSAVCILSAAYYLRNFQKPRTTYYGVGSGGSIGIQKSF